MSGSSFTDWDYHHSAPTTIVTEVENPNGGDSAWFVTIRGDEFCINLAPDDAEDLARRINAKVNRIKKNEVADSPKIVRSWGSK